MKIWYYLALSFNVNLQKMRHFQNQIHTQKIWKLEKKWLEVVLRGIDSYQLSRKINQT